MALEDHQEMTWRPKAKQRIMAAVSTKRAASDAKDMENIVANPKRVARRVMPSVCVSHDICPVSRRGAVASVGTQNRVREGGRLCDYV